MNNVNGNKQGAPSTEAMRAQSEQVVHGAMDRLLRINRRLSGFRSCDYDGIDPLRTALDALGDYMGVAIHMPTSDAYDPSMTLLEHSLQISGVRHRNVTLHGKWWKRAIGPIMAHLLDGTPVALLPGALVGYTMIDPHTGAKVRVDAKLARGIAPAATQAFRAFPEGDVGAKSLLRFVFCSSIQLEIALIFLLGFAASLIQVLPPILSAQIFDQIVPGNMRGMLTEVILILISFQIAQMGINVVTNLGFSRIKTKVDLALQAALWDRMLSRGLEFFFRFTAGELLGRISGISKINAGLTLDTLKTLVTALFSFVSLVVMFAYSPAVARCALWMLAGLVLVSALLIYQRYKLGVKHAQIKLRAGSLNHQLIAGIQRIKASRAEDRAFAMWSALEAERRYLDGRTRVITALLEALYAFFSFASLAAIYFLIAHQSGATPGVFVAFIGAYLTFQTAMLNMLGVLATLLDMAPLAKGAAPLLRGVPDAGARRMTPKALDGSLELNHVSFGYEQYGRAVLRDVSLRVEKGESVGIVGLSGSGKSTLLRLMLGLYTPLSGKVYMGGYDMGTLDIHHLRRHLGVVLQNGDLPAGTIFGSVAEGNHGATEEQVKAALAKAELLDEVLALPKGLHTSLEDPASDLSEGQRQRLLIARLMCGRHDYVFLDEATSKLDNQRAQKIMDRIYDLPATKIIVAQRLSTVARCDRILVIEDGTLVAQGSYDEIVRERHLYAAAERGA